MRRNRVQSAVKARFSAHDTKERVLNEVFRIARACQKDLVLLRKMNDSIDFYKSLNNCSVKIHGPREKFARTCWKLILPRYIICINISLWLGLYQSFDTRIFDKCYIRNKLTSFDDVNDDVLV